MVCRVNTPHGQLNQCEYWRELGGSSPKKMNEPSDDSKVVNDSLEVPDQVPAKRQDIAHTKRDATVLDKLKTLS